MNYTDTQLSHRFVRFEIPSAGVYDDIKMKIETYLDGLLANKDKNGVVLARIQEDKDLFTENELAARGTMPRTGNRIITANIVCNVSLEADKYKAFEYQQHVKGNFNFIEDLFQGFSTFQFEEA